MSIETLNSIKLAFQMSANLSNTLADGSTSGGATIPNINWKPPLKNGVGPNLADRSHAIKGTLTAGQSINIDLYNMGGTSTGIDIGAGKGLDALGQALKLEEIVAIAIINNNTIGASGTLEITPAVSNGWSSIGTHTNATGGELRSQGILLKANPDVPGFPVGISDANDQITLKAVGGSVDYIVGLIARSWLESSSSMYVHEGDIN